LWFDPDREQIVLSIAGHAQPFDQPERWTAMMPSAGGRHCYQKLLPDAFLLPPDELGPEDDSSPPVQQTPGVVLIDELDVHLHPSWQRR